MNRAAEADKRTADLRQYTAGEAGQTKEQLHKTKEKQTKDNVTVFFPIYDPQ